MYGLPPPGGAWPTPAIISPSDSAVAAASHVPPLAGGYVPPVPPLPLSVAAPPVHAAWASPVTAAVVSPRTYSLPAYAATATPPLYSHAAAAAAPQPHLARHGNMLAHHTSLAASAPSPASPLAAAGPPPHASPLHLPSVESANFNLVDVVKSLQRENTALQASLEAAARDGGALSPLSPVRKTAAAAAAAAAATQQQHQQAQEQLVAATAAAAATAEAGDELGVRARNIRLQADADELARVLDKRQQELPRLRALEEAAELLEASERRSKDMQVELNRAVDEVCFLRAEAEKKDARYVAAEDERLQLATQVAGLEEALRGREALQHQLVAAVTRAETAESEAQHAAGQANMLSDEGASLSVTNSGLAKQVAELRAEAAERRAEKETLSGRYAQSQEALLAAKRASQALQEKLTGVLGTVSSFTTLEQGFTRQLAERDADAKALTVDRDQARDEAASLRAKLRQAEDALASFEVESEKLQATNARLDQERHDHLMRAASLQEENVSLGRCVTAATEQRIEAEQASQRVSLELNTLQLENTELKQNLLSAENRVQDLQSDVKAMLEEVKELQGRYDAMEAAMTSKLSERGSQVVELQEMLKQCELELARQKRREEESSGRVAAEHQDLARDCTALAHDAARAKEERDAAIGEARTLLVSVASLEQEAAALRGEAKELRARLQSRQAALSASSASFEPVRAVLEERLATWAADNEALSKQLRAVTAERDAAYESLAAARVASASADATVAAATTAAAAAAARGYANPQRWKTAVM